MNTNLDFKNIATETQITSFHADPIAIRLISASIFKKDPKLRMTEV